MESSCEPRNRNGKTRVGPTLETGRHGCESDEWRGWAFWSARQRISDDVHNDGYLALNSLKPPSFTQRTKRFRLWWGDRSSNNVEQMKDCDDMHHRDAKSSNLSINRRNLTPFKQLKSGAVLAILGSINTAITGGSNGGSLESVRQIKSIKSNLLKHTTDVHAETSQWLHFFKQAIVDKRILIRVMNDGPYTLL